MSKLIKGLERVKLLDNTLRIQTLKSSSVLLGTTNKTKAHIVAETSATMLDNAPLDSAPALRIYHSKLHLRLFPQRLYRVFLDTLALPTALYLGRYKFRALLVWTKFQIEHFPSVGMVTRV